MRIWSGAIVAPAALARKASGAAVVSSGSGQRLTVWPFSIARRQEMAGKLLQEEPVTLLVLVGTLQESLE